MDTNNKLIAIFMELETPDEVYFEHLTKEGYRSELTHFMLLEYHNSWSWLMPVVEKVNSIVVDRKKSHQAQGIRIHFDAVYLAIGHTHFTEAIGNGENYCKDLKECIYKLVVEFIKWHNKQPK